MEVEADQSRRRAEGVPGRAPEQAADRRWQAERVMQLRPVAKFFLSRHYFGGKPFGADDEMAPVLRIENDRRISNRRHILHLRIPFAALEDRPAADHRGDGMRKRLDRAERLREESGHAGPKRMT